MRVFGGGCDKRDAAVLDIFKQRLLLLAVEILYLIKVQKNSASAENIVGLCHNILDVGKRCRGGIKTVKSHIGSLGYYGGGGGLARAGRTVEYHICNSAALYHAAYDAALTEKVRLPHYVGKVAGAKKVGKLCVFH